MKTYDFKNMKTQSGFHFQAFPRALGVRFPSRINIRDTSIFRLHFNERTDNYDINSTNILDSLNIFFKVFSTNFFAYAIIMKSRDSSVGIALGYGLDDKGSRV
jgi:hypothetical protein